MRLDTLAELARWEDSPNTPAARQYRQSLEEETELVIQALDRQIAVAMAGVPAHQV